MGLPYNLFDMRKSAEITGWGMGLGLTIVPILVLLFFGVRWLSGDF